MHPDPEPRQFRFTPMQERVGGLVIGSVLGILVWLELSPRFFGVNTQGDPLGGAAVFTYNGWAVGITLLLGLIAMAAGFTVGTDRQFWNFALVGSGVGLILIAAPWLAMEKLDMTPQSFSYRSWWGLSSRQFPFADLAELRLQHHSRPWSRRANWTSVHYKTKAGEEGTLCADTWDNPLYFWAAPHLIRMSRGAGIIAP